MSHAANTRTPYIVCERVTKSFGAHQVLKGVSTQFCQGEVTVIIGASGSGKSTLLRALNRLEPHDGGRITIAGVEVTDHEATLQQQRCEVGMVFQSYNLFPHKTALENVMEGPLVVQKRPEAEVRAEAQALLAKVGLADKADLYPFQLSGGQQQRVGIARAFVTNPEVVFADEPTGNLDTKTTKEVMEMFLRFAREKGTTIILVTHDRSLAEYCDRIVTISDGRIISNEDHRHAKAIQEPPAAPAEELPETLQFTDNTLAAGQGGV